MTPAKPRIHYNEVVTRDGFQIEPAFIPTDTKVALIDALSQCGYAKAEDAGTTVETMTSAQLGDYTRQELEHWGKVIRASKITAD